MSKITSPILLDSTGQDINATLDSIKCALLERNTLIDDTVTSSTRVWSSKKIVEALTTTKSTTGSTISVTPIAATPIVITTTVQGQTTLSITHTNGTKTLEYSIVVPAAGTLNWATGELELTDGTVASLVGHSIMALNGTNTFSINEGTMELKYRTIAAGEGGGSCDCSWDVISGGSAAEEGN